MASRDNNNPLLHLPCNTLRPAHEKDPDATSRRPGADVRVWPHCGHRTRCIGAGIWDRVSLSHHCTRRTLLKLLSIIFVHGLGSNPDTTWRARRVDSLHVKAGCPRSTDDQYVNWVSEFLPHDLPSTVCKDMRIFFYNYDSYWKRDALKTGLSEFGGKLLEEVKTKLRQTEEVRRAGGLVPNVY